VIWLYAGAAVVALGVAAAGGWQVRDWQADADELARTREEAAARLRQVDRGIEAGAALETERARLARELTRARHDIKTALQQPVTCPAAPDGTPGELGDLVIPAAALAGLRRAAGGLPPGPAASEPGRAVQPRAGSADR
jgi:hypothetical protein